MVFTQDDANEFLNENLVQVNRLRKIVTNLTTIRQVLYFTEKLEQIKVTDIAEVTKEWTMEIEALLTTTSVAYGRLFTESKGTPVLKKKLIPGEFLKTHEEIIELRNERYAHHGAHKSTAPELECMIGEDEVFVQLHWRSNSPNGAPANWKNLFIWWDDFLKRSFLKQLEHLSKTSGKRWPEFDIEMEFRMAHEAQDDDALPPLLEHIEKLSDCT